MRHPWMNYIISGVLFNSWERRKTLLKSNGICHYVIAALNYGEEEEDALPSRHENNFIFIFNELLYLSLHAGLIRRLSLEEATIVTIKDPAKVLLWRIKKQWLATSVATKDQLNTLLICFSDFYIKFVCEWVNPQSEETTYAKSKRFN